MNTKLLSAGVVVALILGVTGLFKGGETTIVNNPAPQFAGLELVDSPYWSIGGKQFFTQQKGLTATSSIVCAWQNPFPATSTLKSFSAYMVGASNGNLVFDLSTSSNAFGSSTPAFIAGHVLTAGTQDIVYWTPQESTTTSSRILRGQSSLGGVATTGESPYLQIAPREWLTWRIATGTPSTSQTVTGNCSVQIEKL